MDLELSQRQGLSVAMQTSLHLLQLNSLQLRDYLGELMNSNAVVELEFPEIEYRPGPFERPHAGQANAREDGVPPYSGEELLENTAEAASALHDLFLQSAAMKLPAAEQRMMTYLILSLDERGFLTESAETVAQTLGILPADVGRGIRLLQSMEPAGVGARDLRECLRLQLLRVSPRQDKLALQIVENHLEALAKQQYSQITRALQVTRAQVISACDRIRALNPKPLNGLTGDLLTRYVIPDFYVVEEDGCLHCILNDYFLPKIKIDPSYRKLLQSNVLSANDKTYIRGNYKQADMVVKFLSFRKSTLQRVVEYILQVQGDFFHLGPEHRVPMGNRELAEALSLHESTVSRAVSGKFFECKWGVFPLKALFSRSAGVTSDEHGPVLQQLRELIAGEPPRAAYSDQQLAEMLERDGVHIARRTVAKYRQMLGIPPASRRNAQQEGK